jgi:hypothetical protein
VEVRALGDAERRSGVEEAGVEVPLDVRRRVSDREPAAQGLARQAHVLERDRVTTGGAHAERVPVVVDDDAARDARHHRVAVPLAAVVAGERDGRVEDVGRGRHRAEHLAAGDDPAVAGAGRRRRRPGQVLPRLAHRRREHDAVGRDLPERVADRAHAPLIPVRDRRLPPADDVLQVREVHVDAERQRRVAAREAGRRDQHIVRRRHAEPAEVLRDRRREVAASLDGAEALERVGAVAIVGGRMGRDLVGEPLGERDEPCARIGPGCQLDGHGVVREVDGTVKRASVRYARRK